MILISDNKHFLKVNRNHSIWNREEEELRKKKWGVPQRYKRTNNTYVIGVPELQGEKKNTWAKQLSKETTAQNFVNMVKNTNLQTQEVQWTSKNI